MSDSRRRGGVLHFTKMHGLGNDFMVIDAISQPFQLPPERIRELSDRHFGIGFDQVLVVEPPGRPDVDFDYRIFNADGSEVEQCGNGARCFARFVREQRLTNKDRIRVQTRAGVIALDVQRDGWVTVNMGVPSFEPGTIPFKAAEPAVTHTLEVDGHAVTVSVVSMGNPHAVLLVDSLETAPVETLGPALEGHPAFPERANIGFLEVQDRRHARLRVHERGAGETLACGSGACAALVAGIRQGRLDAEARLELRGGPLSLSWQGEGAPVMMTGPTARVFDGRLSVPGAKAGKPAKSARGGRRRRGSRGRQRHAGRRRGEQS
ncbi:diaminopimelate epimerase [Tamilnaduibacter salinus]|uniref:Diaminopimelate epimerase n=1 Tax=Tamilnaduibacter salinus TaxID=1484056 RepID=A0A2A2I314_9GAMM|nr:diaminopimelate epimerase [Tamilnaduibacter salinus]PAV25423.1 diaminopimelate epimerase [Tamilnaduibacter salinus]